MPDKWGQYYLSDKSGSNIVAYKKEYDTWKIIWIKGLNAEVIENKFISWKVGDKYLLPTCFFK